jgi:hypothetical protein
MAPQSQVVGDDPAQAGKVADALAQAVDRELVCVDEAGLRRPATS